MPTGRRGISEIVGAIIIIGIALAVGSILASYLVSSVKSVSSSPYHLIVREADIEGLGGTAIKVSVFVENPTRHVWNATITGAVLYYDGFKYRENLSIAMNGTATSIVVLKPREIAEVTGLIQAPTIDSGVLDVIVRFVDTSTGAVYEDHIITPWTMS